MNVRTIAGVAILALVFGGIFVASAIDMGWLAAAVTMVAAVVIAAAVLAAVVLISDGMDQR